MGRQFLSIKQWLEVIRDEFTSDPGVQMTQKSLLQRVSKKGGLENWESVTTPAHISPLGKAVKAVVSRRGIVVSQEHENSRSRFSIAGNFAGVVETLIREADENPKSFLPSHSGRKPANKSDDGSLLDYIAVVGRGVDDLMQRVADLLKMKEELANVRAHIDELLTMTGEMKKTKQRILEKLSS